ncbi:MAG: sulfatase [Pigmentiphaga sp.]
MRMSNRPNFLLFITDQQRADHVGAYGNREVATPHLDALAARGWRNERFFVAAPLCMPNRASLLTGRMPTAHGVRVNGVSLSAQTVTFTDLLRETGYATALIGKAHLQNITDLSAAWKASGTVGEARREYLGSRYEREFGPAWRRGRVVDEAEPYYGFEHVQFVINHGDDVDGHYREWLRLHHPGFETLVGPEHAIPTPDIELVGLRQAWRTRLPEELYSTAWIADRTIDYLKQRAQDEKPFFIQCSFPDPHHPFTPPGRYWDMYRPDDVELPTSFHTTTPRPPHVQWLHAQRDAGRVPKGGHAAFAASERQAREAIALNYGSITNIDTQIGRVLTELAQLGLDRDTVVIFTSDHGEFMGDHQLLLKAPLHYQGLVRCPLIWADPKANGPGTSQAMTQTIDLAPTILERAGVTPYNGIQGHSLLPLMRGEAAAVRDSVLIEDESQRTALGIDKRLRMRTLVSDRYRLSVYDGAQWGELYDLQEDPGEERNLWSQPESAAVRHELMERLMRQMLASVDTSPLPTSVA